MGDAEQLLLSFGIDLSPVKEAVKGISSLLGSLNDMADDLDAKTKSATASAKADAQDLKSKADASLSAAKAAILAEQLKTQEEKTATQELQKQAQAQRLAEQAARSGVAAAQQKKAEAIAETAELKVQQALLRSQTAEIQKQVVEIRKKRLEDAADRKSEGGGSGGAGGLLEKITGGILGKGIAGSVAGGVLAGEGIAAVIEGAGSAIERFIEKLKEVSVESGNIVALQQVFDGLATGAGLDAAKMMDNLSKSTEGLVSKLTLLKVATTALRSPYKISADSVNQLAHDVTVLAEASGHTAEQGLQRLNTALERGRPVTLSMITGIAGLRDVMRDIPPTLNPVERSTLMWTRAIKMLHDQAESIGDLPDTFEKMSTRFKVAADNAMLAFGQGFNESPGIKAFYGTVNDLAEKMGGLEAVAKKVGNAVGNVFEALSPIGTEFIPVLQSIYDLFVDLGTVVSGMVQSAFSGLVSSNDSLTRSFQNQHPIMDAFGKMIIEIGTQVRMLANDLLTIGQLLAKIGSLDPRAAGPEAAAMRSTSFKDIMKKWADEQQRASQQADSAEGGFELRGGETSAQADVKDFANEQSSKITQAQEAKKKAAEEDFKNKKISADQLHALEMQYAKEAATARKTLSDEVLKREIQNITTYYDAKRALVNAGSGTNKPADLAALDTEQQQEIERAKKGEATRSIIPPPPNTDINMSEKRRRAQDELQNQMAHNKDMYDLEMEAIQARKEADNQAYKDAEISMQEHYKTQEAIIAESLKDRMQMIDENYAAQKQNLEARKKDGLILQADYDKELSTMQLKAMDQRVQAETQSFRQLAALRAQQHADTIATQKKEIQDRSGNQTAELEAGMAYNQKTVQGGGESVDDYYQKQLAYINQIKQVKIDEAYQLLALQADKNANMAGTLQQVDAAVNKAQRQVEDLLEKVAQLRTNAIEKTYQGTQGVLQSQLSYGQSQQQAGLAGPPIATMQEMLANVQKYRAQLEQEANQEIMDAMNKGVAVNRDAWASVLQKIEATYETQQKYNEELQKMQDYMQPVATMFGEMGKAIDQIWTGKSMSNVGQMIQTAAASFKNVQQDVQTAFSSFGFKGHTTVVQKDPATLALEQQAKDIFNPASSASSKVAGSFDLITTVAGKLVGAFQSLYGSLTGQVEPTAAPTTQSGQASGTGQPISVSPTTPGQAPSTGGGGGTGTQSTAPLSAGSGELSKFVTGITSATSAVMGFIGSITKATSAAAGAAGGGLSGAGLGGSIGGQFSSISALAGPIGAIAGGVGGALIGMITGSKNNQIAQNIKDLNESMTNIMAQFNQNTNNLQIAISQMQSLIAEAEQMEASSKKGGQQYQQLIQQYTQQLQSLEDQQIKIIQNMQNSLAILQTPLGGQSYINSVEQLLTQYQQFVGAAQNANQLAQANEFLSQSLQNLATNYGQQLLQNESQAVQDALQLNTLYQQRLQYVNSLNNQIQGVLEQGSLTRQQTLAQKKGQQIEQIQAGANIQLDQMNQEIALQQMKVSAESQVFSLATTRIGLETQLLQLQGAQTAFQMAQISAMQQLVNTLAAGNYNFQTLQALLNALGFTQAAQTAATSTTTYGGNYSGGAPAPTPTPPNPVLPTGGDGNAPSGMTVTSNSQMTMGQIEQLFASAYADRGSIGYGNYRGQNL